MALIGYGKMGKEIEKIALERGHEITVKITSKDHSFEKDHNFLSSDVAIEFTRPDSAFGNLMKCISSGIPTVCGTTGWYDRLDEIKSAAKNKNIGFFYASNFSIGVNIFFEINKLLARLMNRYPEYQCYVKEIHHIHKLDKPSGTALTLINDILKENKNFSKWAFDDSSESVIPVTCIREGEVPGTHEICFESPVDSITLRHEAKNRKGFALGSVLAAEWIQGKTGVFTMSDLLFGN
ncbi:MAG: 4-hydroxy-tetrahydrodipicolinate reductase [Bacteroidia bacterium]|nr:4-hydroxy-tetrahydrodipicolinate reductase [Bacteroidia bacterium]